MLVVILIYWKMGWAEGEDVTGQPCRNKWHHCEKVNMQFLQGKSVFVTKKVAYKVPVRGHMFCTKIYGIHISFHMNQKCDNASSSILVSSLVHLKEL